MKRLLLLVSIVLMSQTNYGFSFEKERISGNRNVASHERQIENFDVLEIDLACKVILKQDKEVNLLLRADENLHEIIKTEVKNGTLRIYSDYNIISKKTLTIYLTINDLKEINISGAVKMENGFDINLDRLRMDINGAADLDLNINADEIIADFSGATNADFTGQVRYFEIDASGTANLNAYDLIIRECKLDFSGLGKASLHVTEYFDVTVSGMGIVSYIGDPKVKKDVSGLGIIREN